MANKLSEYDSQFGPLGNPGSPREHLIDSALKEAGSGAWISKALPMSRFSDSWRPGVMTPQYEDVGGVSRVVRILQPHLCLDETGEAFVDGGADAVREVRIAYGNLSHPEQPTAKETKLTEFEARTASTRYEREDYTWGNGQIISIAVSHIADFTIPLIP